MNHPPGSSMVWLIATSSKTILTTWHGSQDCCCQCLCPRSSHYWPITLQETLKHSDRSGSVSCGDHCSFPWVLVNTSFHLCPPRVWGLRFAFKYDLNVIAPLFLSHCSLSFVPDLFWWVSMPSCWLSAASCKFGVLTGEDECRSF